MRVEPVQQRPLVIAQDHGLEPALDPLKGFGGVWPALNEIADPEEPVVRRIEVELAKDPLKGAKVPMEVAHDEITTGAIGANRGRGHRTLD